MRWRLRAVTLSLVLAPFACKRVPEPAPADVDASSMEKLLAFANETGSETLAELAASSNSAVTTASPSALASASALLAAFASASAIPSGSTSVVPSASLAAVASSASASASAAASVPVVPLSPLATKLLGAWVFSKFDLSDASTATKWKAVPEAIQKEILKEAPKASIEFTPTHIVSRLSGVPDKKSTWSVESEAPDGELTIKTSDDGRKKLKFVGDDLRIVDVDKKDAFVSLFARKPK
jgi:hypothetical protein